MEQPREFPSGIPTAILFECARCEKQAVRPNGQILPAGWTIDAERRLICDDCQRIERHEAAVAAAGGPPPAVRLAGPADEATVLMLRSGALVDLADPDCSRVHICDIAAGLARQCRWAGQIYGFYSVAEHSMILSHMVPPEAAWAALMHDAAEAIIGDVVRPLKALLPDYRRIEARLEERLFERFMVDMATHGPVVKAADALLAKLEHAWLYGEVERTGPQEEGAWLTCTDDFIGFAYRGAQSRFLDRVADLAPFADWREAAR